MVLPELSPIYDRLRFAARIRAVMMFVVALALSINLITGSYSGLVHAHDHEHEQSDHHHDDHDASDKKNSVDVAGLETGDTSGTLGPEQTHEHPADIALSLTPLMAWKFPALDTSWSPSRSKTNVVFDAGPSDRPPRGSQII